MSLEPALKAQDRREQEREAGERGKNPPCVPMQALKQKQKEQLKGPGEIWSWHLKPSG